MITLHSRPVPLVLTAPSGAGKTSIGKGLVTGYDGYSFSVSATTRRPRPGEEDGRDYHFMDKPRFQRMVEGGEFAEWAQVHGNLYGTPSAELLRCQNAGHTPVLDIDVQGALQVRDRIPDSHLVFILPPSADEMLKRLRGRATEGTHEIQRRLDTALAELGRVEHFHHVVVNSLLHEAIDAVHGIVVAEGRRTKRRTNLLEQVEQLKRNIEADLRVGS